LKVEKSNQIQKDFSWLVEYEVNRKEVENQYKKFEIENGFSVSHSFDEYYSYYKIIYVSNDK
jgi:hypothetical protein